MILNLPAKIIKLAKALPAPLYVVGGYVRNFLIDKSLSEDIDVCAPLTVDELLPYFELEGIEVVALYKRTGTILFKCDGVKYEFTSFRKDEYDLGGTHTPDKTEFTKNILDDAKRRDFKCNAIYYDIALDKIVDPLNGIADVENRVLDTVVSPRHVFKHDGLRLMRLARFAGELGFTPTAEVVSSAKENAVNIKDISAERIYEELKRILVSDTKYSFSDKRGHYTALKILGDTGVLDFILPELAIGRGMEQNAKYHKYDVLEHSLRACLYSDQSIRLIALLHDIGKPYCKINYGKYSGHAEKGVIIAETALKRLKADNKTVKLAKFLIGAHMLDVENDLPVDELKVFIVKNYPLIESLLMLKLADRTAYRDDSAKNEVVDKWQKIIRQMRFENTPMRVKDLKITPEELKNLGVQTQNIGKVLDALWVKAIINPNINEKQSLIALLKTISI